MVCPITPTPAFPHDHHPDPLQRHIDIGPMFADRTPLRLAELLEHSLGGFQPPGPGVRT